MQQSPHGTGIPVVFPACRFREIDLSDEIIVFGDRNFQWPKTLAAWFHCNKLRSCSWIGAAKVSNNDDSIFNRGLGDWREKFPKKWIVFLRRAGYRHIMGACESLMKHLPQVTR